MEEIAQFVAAAQEEIRQDIGSLFRGAIRLMLECLLEQGGEGDGGRPPL